MEALDLAESILSAAQYRKLYTYRPYGHPDTLCPDGRLWRMKRAAGEWVEWSNKPWQYDFHKAGAVYKERMLMAANRPGKTVCAAAEVAYHMTGDYPDWWEGIRFDKPVLVWTGSPTNETSRDIVQRELLGGTDNESLGTGFIPRALLYGKPRMRQAGVADVVDNFKVRRVTGGVSQCVLKTYEQGWRKWQGTAPHVLWLDEEPDESAEQKKIYTEAITRLLTSKGTMMVTFTPLLGQTRLVRHFQKKGAGVYLDTAIWDDAPHLATEDKAQLLESYPEHERDARSRGVPMMGEGAVFYTDEEQIKVPHDTEIPPHFARIKGIDFGAGGEGSHPKAFGEIAYDRDKDIIYIVRTWKRAGVDIPSHCEVINETNPWAPVAWPHDGWNKDANGKVLISHYRGAVRCLSMSACYSNDKQGAQPVEPIFEEFNIRARDGRLKVLASCHGFFDEWRNAHRKDGKIVPINDDILKACMYAVMMRRYAITRRMRSLQQPMPARGLH